MASVTAQLPADKVPSGRGGAPQSVTARTEERAAATRRGQEETQEAQTQTAAGGAWRPAAGPGYPPFTCYPFHLGFNF